MHTVSLPDETGAQVPWLGYGSGSAHYAQDCTEITLKALQAGFTHLDAAQFYQNEASVGAAIAQFTSSDKDLRKTLFVTTKLGMLAEGQSVEANLRESLGKLQLEYVDLFLIHIPTVHLGRPGGFVGVWKEVVELKKLGLAKSVGVSNFNRGQLQDLLDSGLEKPAVNQIEYHAFQTQKLQPLLDLHVKHNIVTESYGGLTPLIANRFENAPQDVQDARSALITLVESIAAKHSITTSQVLLKWLKAKGVIAVTTSTQEARIKEYLAEGGIKELEKDEVEAITGATGGVNHRFFTMFPHMDEQ